MSNLTLFLIWILCGALVWLVKARDPKDPWHIHGYELTSLCCCGIAGPILLCAIILIRLGTGLQVVLGIAHRRLDGTASSQSPRRS